MLAVGCVGGDRGRCVPLGGVDAVKLCRRVADGTWWEPSYADGYDEGRAIADVLTGRVDWYFRGVRWVEAPWWQFWRKGEWVRTGEVWEPADGKEFKVVENR